MQVETYACFEGIDWEILQLLKTARSSVRICVAWINDRTYGETLRALAAKNVEISIIYNDDGKNRLFGIPPSQRIQVYPIRARLSSALMHDKFCIIDNEILINGSYNWSRNAPNSFENIVVVKHDYQLIKQFLYEFNDLLSFYQYQSSHQISRCPICRSYVFNLGILGSESGKYSESQIDVWSVCAKNYHVFHQATQYDQFFSVQMGLDDENQWDEEDNSKEAMLDSFHRDLAKIHRIQNYFNQNFRSPIHAVGGVVMDNHNEFHKFNEPPYYAVKIGWRNMFYRKIIPSQIDSGEGDIDQIIDEHIP